MPKRHYGYEKMDDKMIIEEDISHVEIASVNFDQWALTVSLRVYAHDQTVKGMTYLIFQNVRGFRYLDEGDMLQYPFPKDCTKNYVQVIDKEGWSEQEENFGNIVTSGHREYLVATDNEYLSVLAHKDPTIIKE